MYLISYRLKYLLIITALAVTTTFTGCQNPLAPFDGAAVDQLKDKAVPVITVTSPESDTIYAQTVTVTGTVSDDGDELPVLTWTVTDSLGSREKNGTIELSEVETDEGVKAEFSFQFTTSEYSSDILVEISGTDWNENISIPVKLRLIFPGNTIPSFYAVASSKTISCSWDAVEGASLYRIYYTTDGSIPYENYGESTELLTEVFSASSPYIISGLKSGAPHVLRLMAYSADGDSWSSELKTIVPLSELTLYPRTDAGCGYVKLEWNDTSDYYGYEVFRAESSAAVPVRISGVITGNSFTDTRVSEGVSYYYYIKPAIDGAAFSAAAVCSSFPLFSSGERTVSSVINQSNIKKSQVYNSRMYLLDNIGNLIVFDISDPEKPEYEGRWNTPFSYSYEAAMTFYGDYAFIGKANHIFILDISGQLPILIDTVDPDDNGKDYTAYVYSIAARNGKLYVVSTSTQDDPVNAPGEGVYVYNIASDGSLTETSFNYYALPRMCSLDLDPDGAGDLFLTYFYTSSYPSGVFRVDPDTGSMSDFISLQSAVLYRGAIVDEELNLVISVQGDYSFGDPIYKMEFRYLTSGYSAGTHKEIGDTDFKGGYLRGDLIHLTQTYTMSTYKITGEPGLYQAGNLYDIQLQGNSAGISAYGDYSVCGTMTGMQIINTKPKEPAVVMNSSAVDIGACAVDVAGDLVFVGRKNGMSELSIYSFADKSSPELLAESEGIASVSIYGMIVAGDYVFFSNSRNGFTGIEVLDISNFSTIKVAGSFETETNVLGMTLYGDFLICYCNGFVEILDVSNPASILRVSRTRVSTSGNGDVVVKGNYLFAGYEGEGLTVYDISNLSEPEQIITLDGADATDGQGLMLRHLTVSDDKLYGYGSRPEIIIIDISNPENPRWLNRIDCIVINTDNLEISYSGIDAAGDYVFFNGWPEEQYDDNGLHIYNTDNIASIEQLEINKMEDMGQDEGGIKLYGGYCYVAAGELLCLDIDP